MPVSSASASSSVSSSTARYSPSIDGDASLPRRYDMATSGTADLERDRLLGVPDVVGDQESGATLAARAAPAQADHLEDRPRRALRSDRVELQAPPVR
jgi:hypothetical protein